jgi:hypothetical protein
MPDLPPPPRPGKTAPGRTSPGGSGGPFPPSSGTPLPPIVSIGIRAVPIRPSSVRIVPKPQIPPPRNASLQGRVWLKETQESLEGPLRKLRLPTSAEFIQGLLVGAFTIAVLSFILQSLG